MGFWIVAFALSLTAAGLIARALARGGGAAHDADTDVQVYRDQLSEVDRDRARGVLSDAEAERLRIEVSRRLLEADRAGRGRATVGAAPGWATGAAITACGIGLVGGAFAIYAWLGAPGYPDMPLQSRIAAAEDARQDRPSQAEAEAQTPDRSVAPSEIDPEFETLIERLRTTMDNRPDDRRGQELLAVNEARLGNFAAAARAQERVVALKGAEAGAEDYAQLAEMLVAAAGGYVSPEAESAITRALKADGQNPQARYYAGLLYAQTGRPDRAFRIWRRLLEESPGDAPWVPPIRARIDSLAQAAGVNYSAPEPRGPSAADIAAAEDMSAEDRQEMIRGMVSRLSDRLATEGGPAADWARLIGAYGVLGDTEAAAEIWAEAQDAFSGDTSGLEQIRAAAEQAGVTE